MSPIPDRETLLQMAWEEMKKAEDTSDYQEEQYRLASARNLMLMASQFLAPEQVREQAEIHAEVSTKAALKAAAQSQEKVVELLGILQAFMEAVENCNVPLESEEFRRFLAPYERATTLIKELTQEANHEDR